MAGAKVGGVELDALASTDHAGQTTSIKSGGFGSLIFSTGKKREGDNDNRETDHGCPIIRNEGHRLVRAWRLSEPDTNQKQYQ